jgi:prepilin-type processing-associated H-X9-DG protein
MALSILLPSLNRAHELANRVKCGSNLRQIGQGMLLYANDHNGQYPPDLGTMLKELDMNPQVLICPSSGNDVPADVLAGGPDMIAVWANQSSDFEYLGAGLKNDTPPDQVLACDKSEHHGSAGINLLFGDGHVEWLTMDAARQAVDRSRAAQNAARR